MRAMRYRFHLHLPLGALFLLAGLAPARAQVPAASRSDRARGTAAPWRTPANWRHGLLRKTPGTLTIGDSGVEFLPDRSSPIRWPFQEIHTFVLRPRRLALTGYGNRRWHLHGDRGYCFELGLAVPPSVAAELAREVGKPVVNEVPDPGGPAFAAIAARHRTLGGGTNGLLRFRDSGIDYVTKSGTGARSWNWSEIETLSLPTPYQLRVGAYRDPITFVLKQAMPSDLFDRLWRLTYARDLNGLQFRTGARP